jgi:hypothetical protein
MSQLELQDEMCARVRAAIKDRATWFALLYRSFREAFPVPNVERPAREAIFEFGRMKARIDPEDFSARAWVEKHASEGSARVFDFDVEMHGAGAVQRSKFCTLVEAWRERGCSQEENDLFSNIAMDGDRGRADAHGACMKLEERIARGSPYCQLNIFDR